MTTSLTLDIKPGGRFARHLVTRLKDRIDYSKKEMSKYTEKWKKAENSTLAYMPEKDVDALRRLEREQNGKPQYTTIKLPYTYGVLMASHTYWTTVFLSRSPVFQYSGRHGEGEDKVQAVEALIDYQAQVGEMLVPLYVWLYDVGKYGFGIIGHHWSEEFVTTAKIVEEEEALFGGRLKTGRMKKRKVTTKFPGYVGNRIRNIRPQDFFPDPRVTLANFQKGEFCGVYFELGWNDVMRRVDAGFYIEEAVKKLASQGTTGFTSDRVEGTDQMDLPNQFNQFTERLMHQKKTGDVFKGFEIVVELSPKDWNLGKGSQYEKWVFTLDANCTTIIGAQPLGYYHDKFPYDLIELEPEGYSVVNRSLPEILEPVQNTMDWLVNSHFYNVRKTLNNQFLLDPSRIVMKDAMSGNAGGIIRAKPVAYGTDLRTAMLQFPVADVTRNHLTDTKFMNEFGQRASGVNDQILGMLVPQGGRKSATEIRTSSTFGTNRLKTNAEFFSAMGWTPFSQKLVQNSQQFYDQERQFKLVGDIANDTGTKFMEVTPELIQGFFDFSPVDGTLPVDRFAQAHLWREIMAQMRGFPQIMQTYDVSKIFSWVARLAGLKNIHSFKIELDTPEGIMKAAQAGNVVPIGGGAPTPSNGVAATNGSSR